MNVAITKRLMYNWLCLVANVVVEWLRDGAPSEDYEEIKPYIDIISIYAPDAYYRMNKLLDAVERLQYS